MKFPRQAACLMCIWASTALAADLPAGTVWEARLSKSLSSYTQKRGTPVEAIVLASPGDGSPFPLGAKLIGELEESHRVGFGLRRGRATMKPVFRTLLLRDGQTVPVDARLVSVDNARETVDREGRIQGIRATNAAGHKMAGITRNLFVWDPLIQMVLAGATMVTLRFPESEIYLPAGSDVRVRLDQPLSLREGLTIPMPPVAEGDEEEEIAEMVASLPSNTVDARSNRAGDIVNLLLIGDTEWVGRAFNAAGWVEADPLSKRTGWKSFRAVAESLPYPEAPMSRQLLNERKPDFQLSKSVNNFSKRHHARMFGQEETFRGRDIHAGSATHDVAIDFIFKRFKFTHVVESDIDLERAKVVNDLVATGCVDAAQLVERPWAPRRHVTPSGQTVLTDGRIAVIELNPCRNPLWTAPWEPAPKPSIWRRMPREFFLTVRNDFTSNNPVYQAGLGIRYLWNKATRGGATPQSR